MSVKFKHCCISNDMDYVEVDNVEFDGQESVRVVVYDSSISTEINLYLDKKTAIRFSKSLRTEINKII